MLLLLVAFALGQSDRQVIAADTNAPASKSLPTAESPASDFADLSLEELGAIKVQMVYGASKHEQKTTEAPASVTIVTRDEIKKFGYRTLGDILNSVRGFYVTSDRGYSYVGARGFNRLNDYGGHMLLMVDGHRLNDPIYDSAAANTDFILDVDLVERVEVIRGPGAALYGNNAFLRAVNVVTRSGAGLGGVELASSYASFDTWTGRATYGQKYQNGMELVLSGSLQDSAGQSRLNYPEFVANHLDGGWARSVFADLTYGDFKLEGGFVDREKDWPTAAFGTVANSQRPRLHTIDERGFFEINYRHEFDHDWLAMGRVYFDRYRYDGFYPYDYDGDATTAPTLNQDLAISSSAGLDFSLTKSLAGGHQIIGGVEYRQDFQLLQQNWDVDPYASLLDSNEPADNYGLFLQDEWHVRTNLILNAGVRYDEFSTFGHTVNPRAALIFSPVEPTTLKFLYGSAFRAPNAYELYYQGFGVRANPHLQPETTQSYELVWEQRLGKRWRSSVSGFLNDVNHLISQRLDPGPDLASPNDDVLFYDNVNSALVRGVEAELEGEIGDSIQVRTSYTFAHATDRQTGRLLEDSPEHMGKLNIIVPLRRDVLFAGFELQAMSARHTIGGPDSPAFAIANFTLFSRELLKGLEMSVSLYNVFDQRYNHPASGDFYYTGPISGNPIRLDTIGQDGRSFRFKLNWRF